VVRTSSSLAALCVVLLSAGTPADETRPLQTTPIDVHSFRVLESYSGPVSYYKIVEDPAQPFIRAVYRPPLETVTLGAEVPDALRQRTKRVRWKWRAQVLPKGGNECKGGFGDSAAVIYVSWKSGLKWYSIKYVWSSEAEKGRICDQKRNLFVVAARWASGARRRSIPRPSFAPTSKAATPMPTFPTWSASAS